MFGHVGLVVVGLRAKNADLRTSDLCVGSKLLWVWNLRNAWLEMCGGLRGC